MTITIGSRYQHRASAAHHKVVDLMRWSTECVEALVYENEATGERWGTTVTEFLQEHDLLVAAVQDSPLYFLEEQYDEQNQPRWLVLNFLGDPALTLTGPHAQMIVLSYLNLRRQNIQRANDYISGVVQGCVYHHLVTAKPTT